MRVCSFGRSLLSPVSGPCSLRRAWRALLAARRRWPDGSFRVELPFEVVRWVDHWGVPLSPFSYGLEFRPLGLVWLASDGCTALSVRWGRG